jgi:hypothetical protein
MQALTIPFVLSVDDYHEFDVALNYIHAAMSNGHGFTEKKKPLDVEEVGCLNGEYKGVVFAKSQKPSAEEMCAATLLFDYAEVYPSIAKARAELDPMLDNQGGLFETVDRDRMWAVLEQDPTFLKLSKSKKK